MDDETRAWLRDLFRDRHQLAESAYVEASRVRKPDLVFRCRRKRHCLAEVYQTAGGTVVHVSAYKFSDRINTERSTAEGRAAHTRDGRGKWKPSTFFLAGGVVNFYLNCTDVLDYLVNAPDVSADLAAGVRERVVPPTSAESY